MNDPVAHVIDDDPNLREFLRLTLVGSGMQACVYPGADAFLAGAENLQPGCIVTDICMPRTGGLELIARLKAMDIRHPVIVITAHGDVALAVEAMKQGAIDFLEKPLDSVRFVRAVRNAFDICTNQADVHAIAAQARRSMGTLSGREREVLQGLVQGKSNKIIARELGIGDRTVEEYRANVMAKMGASNLPMLVQMAMRAGL